MQVAGPSTSRERARTGNDPWSHCLINADGRRAGGNRKEEDLRAGGETDTIAGGAVGSPCHVLVLKGCSMSVKHRADNEKRQRRRRNLALPFIVSVVMAPACSSSSKNDTTAPPAPPPPTAAPAPAPAPTPATPAPAAGPPAPPPTAVAAHDQPPIPPPRNPPRPRKLPDIPAGANGFLVVDNQGQCKFHFRVTCPPPKMCNPPAPRLVNCPPELPRSAQGKPYAGRVYKRTTAGKDVCRFSFNTSCPPTARCNPPPPRKVKCW